MACSLCQTDPNAHSFIFCGTTHDNVAIYYTSPSRTSQYSEDVSLFKLHLDQTKGEPWIWVFDCNGSNIKTPSSLKFPLSILNILTQEHKDTLKGIYILRPNMWFYGMMALVKTFVRSDLMKKVHIWKEESLALYYKFETLGMYGKSLLWITQVMKLPKNIPPPRFPLIIVE